MVSSDPLELFFVNYAKFERASGVHIFHLANQLESFGIRCKVCVPSAAKSVEVFGEPRFRTYTFRTAIIRSYLTKRKIAGRLSLIHAWTPRERVREFTELLSKRHKSRYIVHLEDNEERVTSEFLHDQKTRGGKSDHQIWTDFPPHLSHPDKYRRFLGSAIGVTCINDRLQEFVPDDTPRLVFWPACEPRIFELSYQPNQTVREQYGFSHDDFVVVYPGNVHPANFNDINALYLAVGRLNDCGFRVRLLRIGEDYLSDGSTNRGVREGWLTFISVPDRCIPELVEAANALVQPGRSNSYNDYRFPSKLPMFFASGRPVVLPNWSIGPLLKDAENCLLLEDGGVDEIAAKLKLLITNDPLCKRLGRFGRILARQHFSWETSAARLIGFYRRILSGTTK